MQLLDYGDVQFTKTPEVLGDPRPRRRLGPDGACRLIETYRAAFPDLRFELGEMTSSGATVAHRWVLHGTHRGELMGVEPTGQAVAVDGMELNRLDGGKIAESWAMSDSLGMLRQLGAG